MQTIARPSSILENLCQLVWNNITICIFIIMIIYIRTWESSNIVCTIIKNLSLFSFMSLFAELCSKIEIAKFFYGDITLILTWPKRIDWTWKSMEKNNKIKSPETKEAHIWIVARTLSTCNLSRYLNEEKYQCNNQLLRHSTSFKMKILRYNMHIQ